MNIADLQADAGTQREVGTKSCVADQLLRVTKASLEEYRRHRDLIARTIADIQGGKLPSL